MAPLFGQRYQGPETATTLQRASRAKSNEYELGSTDSLSPLSSAWRRIYHGKTVPDHTWGCAVASRCVPGRDGWRSSVFRRSRRSLARQETPARASAAKSVYASAMTTLKEDEADFFSECTRARESSPGTEKKQVCEPVIVPKRTKRRSHSESNIDQALYELEEQCCRASLAVASPTDVPGSTSDLKTSGSGSGSGSCSYSGSDCDHEEACFCEMASERSGVASFGMSILDGSYAPTDDGFDTWPPLLPDEILTFDEQERCTLSSHDEPTMWSSSSYSLPCNWQLSAGFGQHLQSESSLVDGLIIEAEYELQVAMQRVAALKDFRTQVEHTACYSAASSQTSLELIRNSHSRGSTDCNAVTGAFEFETVEGNGRRANETTLVVNDESTRSSADSLKTTVMLRHIPSDYTRDELLELLDEQGFSRSYDFVYLPVDFAKWQCCGYAFVNLVSHEAALRASRHFDGFIAWRESQISGHSSQLSVKPCAVSWSDPFQGLEANIERYRNSPVMHKDIPEPFKPVMFRQGVRTKFPAPTRKIARPRLKHGSPSKLAVTMAAAHIRNEQKRVLNRGGQ